MNCNSLIATLPRCRGSRCTIFLYWDSPLFIRELYQISVKATLNKYLKSQIAHRNLLILLGCDFFETTYSALPYQALEAFQRLHQ